MDIVTIDFETYYDPAYSLSKLTTEEYVRSPLFEVIGVSVKFNDGPAVWVTGFLRVAAMLAAIDFSNKAILCHNTVFDGAILSWHFGVKPRLWLDTLSMARPKNAVTAGGSLKKLALFYDIGEKGEEVLSALGKHLEDFTPDELARYGRYCINDNDLTKKLFDILKKGFPVGELMIIDQTLRMYTEPHIVLDKVVLQTHLDAEQARKANLLERLMARGISKEQVTKLLNSNVKFAALLKRCGIAPPMKTSRNTGKPTYAFAKTDPEFTALLDHPDERVVALVETRLGTKSTIEETRTQRLLEVSERGPLPIMLNYYGAHTGRFSGGDKLNLQNLPSRKNNAIRRAICAPEGKVLLACDSAQIEARVVAWLAGQNDLVEAFRQGRDIYSEFASAVYGFKVDKKTHTTERFVGKTCIAEGTLVLCETGWRRVETVTIADRVWDGGAWVCHQGLVYNGIKPTLNVCGSWLTPDHKMWSGTQWWDAQSAVQDRSILSRILATAAENLPSQATYAAPGTALPPSSCDATVPPTSTPSTGQILRTLHQHVAQAVRELLRQVSDTGSTLLSWPTMATGSGFSIGWPQLYHGATSLHVGRTSTTVGAGSRSIQAGVLTELLSSRTCRPSLGGTTPPSKWTALMSMAGTNPATSSSSRAHEISRTSVGSPTSKMSLPVYDLACTGPRHRFTILTERGPAIVHNCILGLGYGMGPPKFQDTLASGLMGMVVKMDLEEAKRVVYLYRNRNHRIAALWDSCDYLLKAMMAGSSGVLNEKIAYDADGIILPNGMRLTYHGLTMLDQGMAYVADARGWIKYIGRIVAGIPKNEIPWTYIYGGKVTENIVQALARIVVAEQMVTIGRRYPVLFQVHDENVALVDEDHADEALKFVQDVMSTPPVWAPDLPVACEAKFAANYAEVK